MLNKLQEKALRKIRENYEVQVKGGGLTRITLDKKIDIWLDTKGRIHALRLIMEKIYYKCEICKKIAKDENQKRKENWLQIKGGSLHGISVWPEKPRRKIKGIQAERRVKNDTGNCKI